MLYTVIDREHWPRKEYFEHYLHTVPCTYSMTVEIDITSVRQKKLKLYPTMLYFLAKTVNGMEQFRMSFRESGELVLYETMSPCYTVFHKETKTFSNLWTEYASQYSEFCRRYDEDIACFGAIEAMNAKPHQPENCFTVSMLPWAAFESFHLHVDGYEYLRPIFTLGKYRKRDGRYWIPMAVQVHHAVCDGYHVCSFIEAFQNAVHALDL